MDNKVIVSIVIPLYNKEKFVAETLQSIKGQTFTSWEAMVIDDFSTDNSLKVVKDIMHKDSRFKLICDKQKKKGASASRNIGIKNAKGQYIIFLDADDILSPTCLESRVKYLDQNPHLDFAVFQMGLLGDNDKSKLFTIKKENYLAAFIKHDLPWTITAPIWNKSILKRVNGFDEKYPRLQDPELHTRILLLDNINFEVLPDSEPDCYYRQGRETINLSNLLKGYLFYIKDTTSTLIQYNKRDLYRESLKLCRNSALNHLFRRMRVKDRKKCIGLAKKINKYAFELKLLTHRNYILTNILLLSFYINSFFILKKTRWIHSKILNKLLCNL